MAPSCPRTCFDPRCRRPARILQSPWQSVWQSVWQSRPLPSSSLRIQEVPMTQTSQILIRGGQVYDHDGDVHRPAVADVLIEGSEIAAVGGDLSARVGPQAKIIDAANRLVVPGLINAHYHSHDVLCRGMFEEMPLEMWLLYTLPMGANRTKEEVRARTLVGALESLRAGITTVQDMLGLTPLNTEYTDIVLSAYREAGIRVVFSPMVSDIPSVS